MINIRSGTFAFYNDNYYELVDGDKEDCLLIHRGCTNSQLQRLGFTEYSDQVYLLAIKRKDINSAFQVRTYCVYKDFKYQITDNLKDQKFRIWPLAEAQNHLQDFQRHGYDPVYEIAETDITSIWEEREPLLDFPFKVEKIIYLKG